MPFCTITATVKPGQLLASVGHISTPKYVMLDTAIRGTIGKNFCCGDNEDHAKFCRHCGKPLLLFESTGPVTETWETA